MDCRRKLILVSMFTWMIAAAGIARAEASQQELLELQQRFTDWQVDYVVNDDYTVASTRHFVLQLLTEKAAREAKKYSFSYSTSIETVEVSEAYTLKADGSRVEVPESNYQVTVNRGSKDGGPVFSDRTRTTIVFPDLEAGDSMVLTTQSTESEPMFPGQFSLSNNFYSQTAYDDARVSVSLPAGMNPRMQFRGMEKEVRKPDGRQLISLRYSNPQPQRSKREDFSVWEWEDQPGMAISSFDSYQEIAAAYGERATPKAQPTPRVRELAAEIVTDVKDPREQARRLYDWVATNISYAGNCIGVGAVVPHDTDFILDNRMGDCKDHATLLQALYSSVGIDSVQALINSGSSYRLPRVPMVSSVNHVITYLPQWDQFVDSTNSNMPFDMLGFSVADKPVLLVENYREGLRTPASQWELNSQVANSDVHIQQDGSAKGSVSIALKGMPAVQSRAIWRQLTQQQEQEWLDSLFDGQSAAGSAVIQRDDAQPLVSTFSYTLDFKSPELVLSEGAGGMYLYTLGYSPLPLFDFAALGTEPEIDYNVACWNGSSSETLNYTFPQNMRILAVPDDMEIAENDISYRAQYRLTGNKLVVERSLEDKTPGNVCAPELTNAQRETFKSIGKNLNSQVVYQYL